MKAFFLLIFFFQASLVSALPITEQIRNFYEKVPAFNARFTQILEHKESGSRESRKGNLSFQKPFNIRWQTNKPNEELIIVNDSEIWNYLPDEEIAYRYSPSIVRDSKNIIQVISGQGALEKEFEVRNKGKEGNLIKLQLYPHEPSTQMVEAMLWVNEKSGQITRARILDFYGNANDVTLEDFKNVGNMRENTFQFKPPVGIDIEDRTNETEKNIFN